MRRLLILLISLNILFAYKVKTPSDVFSYAMLLKKKVEYLRAQSHITSPFPKVPPQHNKYPRHVIQKALEILSKINLYRISKGYGAIFIPPYPAREITPSDVYEMVKRLDAEVTPFIKDRQFLEHLTLVKYHNKTPNDVYQLLWSISLAFDSLLGIHGYTPTDVYALSQKLVETVKFIRETQNMYNMPSKPKKIPNLHPNHALYASYDFLSKVRTSEKHLWIDPTEVPKKPHRVITPTDVYDSLQYNIAELQRIKYRLGVERYFKLKPVKGSKTPSDVVQNIKYARRLMPIFSFDKELIQYPISSLQKTPNNVYAVTEEILKKIDILKNIKGIAQKAKNPPYIAGLRPIHAFQKAIEATEKAIRLKVQMGFYPSEVPTEPLREITPNEVYEMVIRLDGIITILLHKAGYHKTEEYIYKPNKEIPSSKTPSDVYHNLWYISNNLDVLLASEYTPNETFAISNRIKIKILSLLHKMKIKKSAIDEILHKNIILTESKTPKDVFNLTLRLYHQIKHIQKRMNMSETSIIIPKERIITPNTVYNALRIINASINEILIYKDIDESDIIYPMVLPKDKTPSDVYKNVTKLRELLGLLYQESDYED
ncbi:MAG: hypothetical protein GXO40_06045 [Epsilonproteobacteria bacterium]|nr:hypothetical protein [Campylobacterota bacterium]